MEKMAVGICKGKEFYPLVYVYNQKDYDYYVKLWQSQGYTVGARAV
jgi:hypothetical protein